MKRKPVNRNKGSQGLGKGFTSLGDFQINKTGKVAGKYDPNAIVIDPKKVVPVSSKPHQITLKNLNRTTRIINSILRTAVREKKIYATRASLIQDLLNRGIIRQGIISDLIYLNKSQFETEVREILRKQ